jgi:hypothetical protein
MSAPDFSSPLRTRSRMRSTILSDVRGPKSGVGSGVSPPQPCSHARTHAAGLCCAPDTISASSSSSNTSSASSSCQAKAIREFSLTHRCPAHQSRRAFQYANNSSTTASFSRVLLVPWTNRRAGKTSSASEVYPQGRGHPTLKMRSMSACAFSLMTRPSLASRPDPPSAAAETGSREARWRGEPHAWRPEEQPGREPCVWRHDQRGANTPQAA